MNDGADNSQAELDNAGTAENTTAPLDAFIQFAAWMNEVLEEATQEASEGMSKKEGLVLLILYKRNGHVIDGTKLEEIYRSWNYAHYSERVAKDLGFALAEAFRMGRIEAERFSVSDATGRDSLTSREIAALGTIRLTPKGWKEVNAMRQAIERRLNSAKSKFAGHGDDLVQMVRELALPPGTEPE